MRHSVPFSWKSFHARFEKTTFLFQNKIRCISLFQSWDLVLMKFPFHNKLKWTIWSKNLLLFYMWRRKSIELLNLDICAQCTSMTCYLTENSNFICYFHSAHRTCDLNAMWMCLLNNWKFHSSMNCTMCSWNIHGRIMKILQNFWLNPFKEGNVNDPKTNL